MRAATPPTRSALVPWLALLTLAGCGDVAEVFDGAADAAVVEVYVGDDCDPARPVFCSGDRIARCDEDGVVVALETDCAATGDVCATGNGTAECVLPDRRPCLRDRCEGDAEMLTCGATGHFVGRDACLGDRVCAEGNGRLDCVLPGRETCETDRCGADGDRVERCGRTGHVDQWVGCGEGGACAEADGYAACVDASLTPCDASRSFCAEDAVVVEACDETLGLQRVGDGPMACDAERDRCVERDGAADCALTDAIPCAVERQTWEGETLRTVADAAPTVCLDDRLVRCNAFGQLATATVCELGCEVTRWDARTWLAACR